MERINAFLICILMIVSLTFCGGEKTNNLSKFPKDADPVVIGNLIINRFLEQPHSQYGSPLRISEPRTQITYPDVCVWLGGLWFANATNDKRLLGKLEDRFTPLFSSEAYLLPKPNHVDNNVFGALPLELFLQTGKEQYKTLGLNYADTQWKLPKGWTLEGQQNRKSDLYGAYVDADIYQPEQKMWAETGLTWQTRFWLDDMFMITAIQAQAYRVTKDTSYINRAAREMVVYLDSIQQPSGLFYHAPTAPFSWGRGNGWMAVGMTELLRSLPKDNPNRPKIMNGYLKMMEKLKACQGENGMWKQLVDVPEMWDETSGTAMFTYSMIVGVKNGWLNPDEYGKVARKGWIALSKNIEPNGDVRAVCEGTNIGSNLEHYKSRKALTGDLHGQAPVLWCAFALINN